MEKYFEIIKKCPLFTKIEDHDLSSLLGLMNAEYVKYDKDIFVFKLVP